MELVEPDVYVKNLSAPMRAFIAPCDSFKPGDLCRCQILAGYFDNAVTPIGLCDVCRMRRQGNAEVLFRMPRMISDLTLPAGSSESVEVEVENKFSVGMYCATLRALARSADAFETLSTCARIMIHGHGQTVPCRSTSLNSSIQN